jgi:hypothetical protein
MRSSVKINGVELTRAQIEGALKELNTPVNPTPAERHGLVRRYDGDGDAYLVLDPERLRQALKDVDYWSRKSKDVVVLLNSRGHLSVSEEYDLGRESKEAFTIKAKR